MNETIKGGIVGSSTVLIGFPLDTIKTFKQNNQMLRYSVKNLYRGMSAPLGFSVIFNSSLFTLHNYFNKEINNHFISGFIAGSLSAPIISTIELYKINKQLQQKINIYRPLLGCGGSICREGVASAFYFGMYNYYKDKGHHPAVAGGVAGCSSWLFSYQIDTIKTRIQSGLATTYIDAIKQGNLNRGLTYCLCRAVIVNSIGFYIYDTL